MGLKNPGGHDGAGGRELHAFSSSTPTPHVRRLRRHRGARSDVPEWWLQGDQPPRPSRLGRKVVVVGACTGIDAHTVGIDAILNMKGYAGDKGLEGYKWFDAYNLGAQVDNDALAARARELNADAVLVTQIMTQRNCTRRTRRSSSSWRASRACASCCSCSAARASITSWRASSVRRGLRPGHQAVASRKVHRRAAMRRPVCAPSSAALTRDRRPLTNQRVVRRRQRGEALLHRPAFGIGRRQVPIGMPSARPTRERLGSHRTGSRLIGPSMAERPRAPRKSPSDARPDERRSARPDRVHEGGREELRAPTVGARPPLEGRMPREMKSSLLRAGRAHRVSPATAALAPLPRPLWR